MNLFKKLATLFAASSTSRAHLYSLTVQCDRCGEVIHAHVNLSNDLSAEYDEASNTSTLICRKVLTGNQHCYQRIEVMLTFDANRKLVERKIENGKFVEQG